MPCLNTTYLALPVAPGVPVISTEASRKYAVVCYDAALLPDEMRSILDRSAALSSRLLKAVHSLLDRYPSTTAHRSSMATSTYAQFSGIPLEALPQVTRVISRTVSEQLVRELDPVLA